MGSRSSRASSPRRAAARRPASPSRARCPPSTRCSGGGPLRGSSLALIGPSGAGKSSVAAQYAYAAACRGERVAMYAFDESAAMLLARSAALGTDLAPHVEGGVVSIHQVDPAELSPGEFSHHVRAAVEGGAGLVVVDSLSGLLAAMPEERFVLLQLHELLAFLAQRGVLTIVTLTQHGLLGVEAGSPIDMSYLADAVLSFRYFEADGKVRKALSAVKHRAGSHESTIRELLVTGGHLAVGPVLEGFRGILTGVPEPLGSGDPPKVRHARPER